MSLEKLKLLLGRVKLVPLSKLVVWLAVLLGLVLAATATIAFLDNRAPRLIVTIVLVPLTAAFIGTALVVGAVTLARILDDLITTWTRDE